MNMKSTKCNECNGDVGYLSVPFYRKDETVYICDKCYIDILNEYEDELKHIQHNLETDL